MPAASLLVLAVLAQPVPLRVEVVGRGGEAFWSAGARGGDLWERVRGDVQLEARRSADGSVSAKLVVSLLRGAEQWTVDLSRLRPGRMVLDADIPGPGGLIHAAAAFGGTARVTRAGEVIADAALLRAAALTTGFHADDGTFRTLPAGRSGDLELLVHLEGLPGGETLDLGFEHPDIRIDGRLVVAAPMADATAPAWPGASLGRGVGGSGMETPVLPGPVPPLLVPGPPPSSQAGATTAPPPLNAEPALPLPSTLAPASARPAEPLPSAPPPANAGTATPLLSTPAPAGASDAPLLPTTPAPENARPALPLPMTPAPTGESPALPLPATPAPAGSMHG